MYKKEGIGVLNSDYASLKKNKLNSWDGAKAFLEIVRHGSFRKASQALNISVNTLRRQVDNFEADVGSVLLTRNVEGVHLTAEGELLVENVIEMEKASLNIARVRNMNEAMQGEVRLGITEGLGTFWVAPRLVELQQAYPKLLVNIRCSMDPADVLRLESDISVQLHRPVAKDLRLVKIGTLHSMLFASEAYVAAHGCPGTLEELRHHKLILQESAQVWSESVFKHYFPDTSPFGLISFKSNMSCSHYWLVKHGGGIGNLPTYAVELDDALVPVNMGGVHFQDDIWLTYHPDVARIPRVRRLIDWLIDVFSSKRFPYFASDFVHPDELRRMKKAASEKG